MRFIKQEKRVILNSSHNCVKEKIGSGAYGNIHKAVFMKTGEEVCAKVLQIEKLGKDEIIFYQREVTILSKCNSPFLLGLVGFTIERLLTIFTPFVPMGSLYQYVAESTRKPRIPKTNLTIIAMGISYAMCTLHRNGIIHRDLKSLNILLDKWFLPYVADFGLSRSVERVRAKSKRMEPMTMDLGTKPWMAPEMFLTSHYDEKVDVYSYGMILYEMLMNRPPFSAEKPRDILTAVKRGERPKLPEEGNGGICELIRECWADDPEGTFMHIFGMISKNQYKWIGSKVALFNLVYVINCRGGLLTEWHGG